VGNALGWLPGQRREELAIARILVIEDDALLAETYVDWLKSDRHTVEAVTDGDEGQSRLRHYDYDLLIVDWELPITSGIDIIRQFRSDGGQTPILMLTGRSSIDDKETGFELGADDYLTKPFEMRELSSRVRALLRRTVFHGDTLTFQDIKLNVVSCSVTKDAKPIPLARRELSLLELFMRNPNQLFTAEMLIERVWHGDESASIGAVRASITRLRKALDDDSAADSIISSVHGLGYRLKEKKLE
jgi:DNA-binding response OmpR family regulator